MGWRKLKNRIIKKEKGNKIRQRHLPDYLTFDG